jgi:hypothetical protein
MVNDNGAKCNQPFRKRKKTSKYCSPECYFAATRGKTRPPRPPEVRAKISASHMGRPVSEETRRKLSEWRQGRKAGPMPLEVRAKISAAHKGRKKSPEHIAAMARAHCKGRPPMPAAGRWADPRYYTWQAAVFERDKHTCQSCGYPRGGSRQGHRSGWVAEHDLQPAVPDVPGAAGRGH